MSPPVRKEDKHVSLETDLGQLFHDFVPLSISVLGDVTVGRHQLVRVDLLECLNDLALPLLAPLVDLCEFGPETGLSRSSHCLVAVTTSSPALQVTKMSSDHFLRPFLRLFVLGRRSCSCTKWLGTDRIDSIQMCDACVCSTFPTISFGKVALFSRVPSESISLRDCTAKGEGFVSMWQTDLFRT